MLANYLKSAVRNLNKSRMYSVINLVGLSIGLTIFLFSLLLANYENNHDHMFSKRDQIYTLNSIFAPTSGEPIKEYPDVRLAYGPLLNNALPGEVKVVRSLHRELAVDVDGQQSYQGIRFVDPDYHHLFDFHFLKGRFRSKTDHNGLVLTESTAEKLFGQLNVIGRKVTVAHNFEMQVVAVIEDVAADSHFNSSLLPNTQLSMIASINGLTRIDGFDLAGEWKSLNPEDLTYVLLPEKYDGKWLQQQVDQIYERYTPQDERLYISGINVRPLRQKNIQVWKALGFPVIESVQLLGLLILMISCLNYANLATAQSFYRTREVGLRKTFGASKSQLLIQYLTESLCMTSIAGLVSLSIVEVLTPAYNGLTGKAVMLDYLQIIPWLLLVIVFVAALSGGYPAYLIARESTIDSLHKQFLKGRKGLFFRSLMISLQFAISIFILAMVLIIYFQNVKMRSLSDVFPIDEVEVLGRVEFPEILAKEKQLRQHLSAIDGVKTAAFSSSIPFNVHGGFRPVTRDKNDDAQTKDLRLISVDQHFISLYEIGLVSGRKFQVDNIEDQFDADRETVNVILNELAVDLLGWKNSQAAIASEFFKANNKEFPTPRRYRIIGVMPNQYFHGVHMEQRPLAFYVRPDQYFYISLRIDSANRDQIMSEVEEVWQSLVPNYPVWRNSLSHYFDRFFRIPRGIANVLWGFALVALSLALIGLFGLSTFMAQRRTKEIGLRKVMGANLFQIVGLLLWQFSIPVLWSLFVALPLAYFASNIYLDFFPERIGSVISVTMLASLISLLTAWSIIFFHALSVARASPIQSLRYE